MTNPRIATSLRIAAPVLVAALVFSAAPAHAADTLESWGQSISTHVTAFVRYVIAMVCLCGGLGAILWGVIHWRAMATNRNSGHGLPAILASIAVGCILLSFSYFVAMMTTTVSTTGVEFNGSAQQLQMDQ